MVRKLIKTFYEIEKLWVLRDNVLILDVLKTEKNKKQ